MKLKPKQVAALKYLVFQSKDANSLAKRLFAFMIDESKGLTREVRLIFTEGLEGYTYKEIRRAAYGWHDMASDGGTTHLGAIFHATGSKFMPSHLSMDRGFEFGIGKSLYIPPRGKQINLTRQKLERISLKNSGLYSSEKYE